MELTRKISHLNRKIKLNQQLLSSLQQKRLMFGLVTFLLLVASQIAKGFFLELGAVLLFLPGFVVFLIKSRRVASFIVDLKALKDLYQHHQDFRSGRLFKEIPPEKMVNPDLARDLDLGLFFGNLDHSFSRQGETKLNQWICQMFEVDSRDNRLSQIKELIRFPRLIRKIQVQPTAEKIDFARVEAEVRRSFFEEPMPWKWLLPIAWVCLVAGLFLGAPSIFWKASLLVYIATSLYFMGRTQHIFSRLQDLHTDFSQLSSRIHTLETLANRLTFCPSLKKQQASTDVKKLNRLISLMSIKTNPILFYILNIIIPWDFMIAELSEKARGQFYSHFKHWSLEIVRLEALSCLANLKIYHPTTWPEAGTNEFVFVKGLSHPLLDQNKVVTNDFSPDSSEIIIITGSNMSGKSTFLRALGLNFCLANIGAPVFAKSFCFKPTSIVTCIRVSDSLRDGQSYFYAEVQRLKTILEKARSKEILFLIDEPLRGTNNKERLIGNQSYLQKILQAKAHGFISTHDLELTQLGDNNPAIANFHFSEQWEDENLLFDYKIKQGPSRSTNALKILAREGLYSKSGEAST